MFRKSYVQVDFARAALFRTHSDFSYVWLRTTSVQRDEPPVHRWCVLLNVMVRITLDKHHALKR